MSHFAVLVVGPDLDDEGELVRALAPYHEHECTGVVDEYVVHVDRTQAWRDEYAASTERRIKLSDGRLIDPYSNEVDEFGREPTTEELAQIKACTFEGKYRRIGDDFVVFEFPEGTDMEFRVPVSQIKTIAEWLDVYHGIDDIYEEEPHPKPQNGYAVIKDGELVYGADFTNPNAKWDWWVLGGRWQGTFKVKPGCEKNAVVGELGTFGKLNGDTSENFDLVRKADLDFDRMKADAVASRRAGWERTLEKMRAIDPNLGEEDADRIRYEVLQCQPDLVKRWKTETGENKQNFFAWAQNNAPAHLAPYFDVVCNWLESAVLETGNYEKIADWIADAPAISAYAMIADGEWIGRGEMGWFGISSGDEDESVWQQRVEDAIRSLPDDHYLAMVDCHI